MEPRKMRKCLKLLTLLISSLLIATASASMYNMFMSATVGVRVTGMSFVANNPDFTNCTGAITDNNQKVTFSSMNGIAGQEAIYIPVDINNADTVGHDIDLVLDTWTGDGLGTKLYSITVTMYNGVTPQGASIVLYPTGGGTSVTNSTTVNIGTGATWQVEWKVYWKGTAVPITDSVQVNLQLVVKS
ncbi:hypothetical protein MUP77_18990 [Candidatus Bathyarchaeota archaeon]|nr:hypothetical protein [Candidatus Bathyarchaeota archaeon]